LPETSHAQCFGPTLFPQAARRTRWAACLGMVSLLVLGGCTRLQVKLGRKMHLDKSPSRRCGQLA
jgi:hypothetical protein